MDQGNPALEGFAVAPSRGWLTPLRAALLLVGAVLGGVALSLLLGTSSAQAATQDGDGSGASQNPLGSVTSAVTTTVASTVDQTIPAVQSAVHITESSLVSTIPVAEPLVTPVATTVDTALAVVQQLTAPAVDSVLPFAQHMVAAPNWAAGPAATAQSAAGASTGHVVGALPAAQNGAGSGSLPDPILTSSSAAPAAALGVLITLIALVLLAARRRLDDDALPASPTFETDTSPA